MTYDGNNCKEFYCDVPYFILDARLGYTSDKRDFNVSKSQFTEVVRGEDLSVSAKADSMDVYGVMRGYEAQRERHTLRVCVEMWLVFWNVAMP